ncbi:glycosyltransferase [Hymenobacter fastidiosus]
MITYNHEAFIAQAIESVLMQKTDFAVELVIGEDYSTDHTRAVIEDYQQQHPGKIRLVTGPHNVGAQPNFIRTYEACRGQYVAMLEGDDYWTDPRKLRRQVALLDHRPEVVMCFGDCAMTDEQGRVIKDSIVPENFRRELTQRDIVRDYCPPTLSTLYRNHVLPPFPAAFTTVSNGDYFLYSLLTEYGTAAYQPGVVAHYRQHGGGIWSSLDQEKRYRQNLRTKLTMLEYFRGRYHAEIMASVNWYYIQLCTLLWQQQRWGEFRRLFAEFTRLSVRTLNKELPAFTLRLLTGRLPLLPLSAP